MSRSLSLAVVLLPLYVAAYPVQGPVSDAPPVDTTNVWVDAPKGRGTVNILVTCVATLTMCVWTAIHLNIRPREPYPMRLMRKFKWVIIGLLAPELVLWSAFTQWINAKILLQAIQKPELSSAEDLTCVLEECEGNSKCDEIISSAARTRTNTGFSDGTNCSELPEDRRVFTPELAFFAVMGGYAVKTSAFTEDSVLSLTPCGVLFLQKTGHFPKKFLKHKDLKDRSKADLLAKTVVCLQAGWMILQCVGRKVNGLPVTLIELHVVVHVVCAVVMYAFWMRKPLDVAQATTIKLDKRLVALLCALSEPKFLNFTVYSNAHNKFHTSNDKSCEQDTDSDSDDDNDEQLDLNFKMVRPPSLTKRYHKISNRFFAQPDHSSFDPNTPSRHNSKRNSPAANLRESETIVCRGAEHFDPIHGYSISLSSGAPQQFKQRKYSEKDLYKFAMAAKALRELKFDDFELMSKFIKRNKKDNTWRVEEPELWPMLAPHIGDLGSEGPVLDHYWRKSSFAILGLLSIFYGGSHAAAWNSYFPSTGEMWAWRISSCVVAGFIFPLMLLFYLFSRAEHRGGSIMRWVFWTVLSIFAGTYVIVRTFLVVESFVSIRSLELKAYETVNWAAYWPHV